MSPNGGATHILEMIGAAAFGFGGSRADAFEGVIVALSVGHVALLRVNLSSSTVA